MLTWKQMTEIEPALLTLKKLAASNPDSNHIRQMMDDFVGCFARKPELMTAEAWRIARREILDQC